MEQTHVFDADLQKELLLEHERNSEQITQRTAKPEGSQLLSSDYTQFVSAVMVTTYHMGPINKL